MYDGEDRFLATVRVDEPDMGLHETEVHPVLPAVLAHRLLGALADVDALAARPPALMILAGHGVGRDPLARRVVLGEVGELLLHAVHREIVAVEVAVAIDPVPGVE